MDTFSGFACNCGEEEKTKIKSLRELLHTREQVSTRPDMYATHAIMTLNNSYRVSLTYIYYDMWGAMNIETFNNDADPFQMYIQFDIFEDGLAMALDQCYNRWGKERPDA